MPLRVSRTARPKVARPEISAMRLVLDQGVPHDAAALLRSLGYDCTHVGEIGMSKAADEEIVALSLELCVR